MWLHASSSAHATSARVLVDTGSRSAATIAASKPIGIICSSQEKFRSMRGLSYKPAAALCIRGGKLLRRSGLPFYRSSALGKCQVRVIQKPKQLCKMVNNTLLTLTVEFVSVSLSVQERVCVQECEGGIT